MVKNQIKKILVPLDGSKNSKKGLEFAIYLARACHATLTGIHCISAPPHSEFRGVGSVEKQLFKEVQKILGDAKILAAKNGILLKTKIVRGNIGHNIVKISQKKKENFDLIIIGSRGRGTVKEVFFGSVSNYVTHASKVPVLIVK